MKPTTDKKLVSALRSALSRSLSESDRLYLLQTVAEHAYRGKLAGALLRGMTQSWYHSNRDECLQIGMVSADEYLPKLVSALRFDAILSGVAPVLLTELYDGLRSEAMRAMGRAEGLTHSHKLNKVVPWTCKACGFDISGRIPVSLTSLYSWDDVQAEIFARCPSPVTREVVRELLDNHEVTGANKSKAKRNAVPVVLSIIRDTVSDMWDLTI